MASAILLMSRNSGSAPLTAYVAKSGSVFYMHLSVQNTNFVALLFWSAHVGFVAILTIL